jgi:hypothetical protein
VVNVGRVGLCVLVGALGAAMLGFRHELCPRVFPRRWLGERYYRRYYLWSYLPGGAFLVFWGLCGLGLTIVNWGHP